MCGDILVSPEHQGPEFPELHHFSNFFCQGCAGPLFITSVDTGQIFMQHRDAPWASSSPLSRFRFHALWGHVTDITIVGKLRGQVSFPNPASSPYLFN